MLKKQIITLQTATQGWASIPKENIKTSRTFTKLKNLLIKHQNIDPLVIKKIEGYDVSNLGESVIVGSMVAFVDGQPETSLYRKFNIKNRQSKGQNDIEGINQIINRRLNHPEWIYPQLILVDGGKGQVNGRL